MSTPSPTASGDVFICGVMEHIEEAGVHSGDSACSLPPHSLKEEIVADMERQTVELARALNVVGLMNVQFAIQNDDIYILEVNPRASRTVPFVAKVVGLPIAGIAAEVMAGRTLASFNLKRPKLDHVAVKEAVFPFARFPGVDPVLGPEMRSTGEVMGIDRDYAIAFAKSQLGGGSKLPLSGTVFVSVKDSDKEKVVAPIRELAEMGFRIIATRGTKRHLDAYGIATEKVNKVLEGRPHIVDAITNGEVDIVFNTTEGAKALAEFVLDPPLGLALPYPLLYNARRRAGGNPGYPGAEGGQSASRPPAKLCRRGFPQARRDGLASRLKSTNS